MQVLFTGSFDPITLGHIDIIHRLCRMYDRVFVGVAVNPSKTYMFDVWQRIEFVKNSIHKAHSHKVVVQEINGMVADFAYHNNIDVIARGVRDANDLSSEISMAEFNVDIGNVDTILLPTRPELANVSSSAVKSIAKDFGNLSAYVTTQVKHALEVKNGLNLIGIVGRSGSGKSTIASAICDRLNSDLHKIPRKLVVKPSMNWLRCATIDMDRLGHEVYVSDEPFAVRARKELVDALGDASILDTNGYVDRARLRTIVFSDKNTLDVLNHMINRPMYYLFRKRLIELRKQSDLSVMTVLVDAAVLVEHDVMTVVNNQIIHVVADTDVCIQRIMARDNISAYDAVVRLSSQLTSDDRSSAVELAFARDNYGDMLELHGAIDDSVLDWVSTNGMSYAP